MDHRQREGRGKKERNGILDDLRQFGISSSREKMNNYFEKGRDVSVPLVTLPCKQ
jgi:hypothetical protein